ncbi:photosystem I assembly protein Ycf3 [Anaerohalosphaera lusitana]|uniref:Photosystem I assembly protein Ycf3 n=1 Tax=Anaerohalosphaera lusitana TaxID=1936003 RepID=A0A1U9NJJ9_9BACT|nr:ammonia-forming cytochrome c nitrite reductase subunit c552 [Anaerohalosphaera lusitana]AQT68102.1 photosystem I assembly protein Ycf3 [Anaerohalosphaera lusitana]
MCCKTVSIAGLVLFSVVIVGISQFRSLASNPQQTSKEYVGSSQCRSCHEKFYQLWAPSYHGQAMRPYTKTFAQENLVDHEESIEVGSNNYRAVIDGEPGHVLEVGPQGEKKYPILHAMGGKDVFYFLTELERGFLQVLPVAFDVQDQQWFDTAASAVRHFSSGDEDEPLDWKNRAYTFNTSCYGCHVSQLVKNYDPQTDTYNTQWQEPGINCETCHGPAAEHIRVCEQAGQGDAPEDLKLVTVTQSRGYSAHQVNASCSTCHAKAGPITAEFMPGDAFFKHYDLTTLEHPDYYPDGRDLGENYTYTSWLMNSCVESSDLDCMYCHTSSGRYRFEGSQANDACIECHEEKADIAKHSRHATETGVTECVQCHMPKTEFGRMARSDHSFRPPMPSATLRYKSPNACNICHTDKDASWADDKVRRWHDDDYQEATLQVADLVAQARQDEWENLPQMLDYIQQKDRNVVFANSLIRLMRQKSDPTIGSDLCHIIVHDKSPLIRASAADALGGYLDNESISLLAEATTDEYLLVRIRAAAALSPVPVDQIPPAYKAAFQKATDEYLKAMMARPDNAFSHYNLGNFFMDKNKPGKAINRFEFAMKLDHDLILPYVNASIAYNTLGQNDNAIETLKKAIEIDPENVAAHLNLALLYGETGNYSLAEQHFRRTYELDADSAAAAYNLSVLLAEKQPLEAIDWARKAVESAPDNTRYVFALAYFLQQNHKTEEAIVLLEPYANAQIADPNIYMLLASIYEGRGDLQAAIRTYKAASENEQLPQQIRTRFRMHVQRLNGW